MCTRELHYELHKKMPYLKIILKQRTARYFSHPVSNASQTIVYLFACVLSEFSAHAISFPIKKILHVPSRFLLHSFFSSEDVGSNFFQNMPSYFGPLLSSG
jgi:hypothetical protein